MSWQSDLARAAAEARCRRGRVEPWWVWPDGGASRLWVTTRESGEDAWTFHAVARTLHAMGAAFAVTPSTDPGKVRLDLAEPRPVLAVDESDMRLVMASVRMSGLHGRYRKAGTAREYEF